VLALAQVSQEHLLGMTPRCHLPGVAVFAVRITTRAVNAWGGKGDAASRIGSHK